MPPLYWNPQTRESIALLRAFRGSWPGDVFGVTGTDDADVLMALHTPIIAEVQGSYGCAIVSPTIQEVRESLAPILVKALVDAGASGRATTLPNLAPPASPLLHPTAAEQQKKEEEAEADDAVLDVDKVINGEDDVDDADIGELDDVGLAVGVGPFEF
jgi:hypothetical protein